MNINRNGGEFPPRRFVVSDQAVCQCDIRYWMMYPLDDRQGGSLPADSQHGEHVTASQRAIAAVRYIIIAAALAGGVKSSQAPLYDFLK